MADFGARFVAEMRRLTNSTWGLTHAKLTRVEGMDGTEFLATFGARVLPFGSDWLGSRKTLPPEDLAREVVEEGQRRARNAGSRWDPDPFLAVLDLLW